MSSSGLETEPGLDADARDLNVSELFSLDLDSDSGVDEPMVKPSPVMDMPLICGEG